MSLATAGYVAAGSMIISIAAAIGGYAHGVETGRREAVEQQREDIDAALAERDRLREQIEAAALNHLKADRERQATNREIVRESTRIVERPVYRNICVDADGVRLLDRAQAAANGRDGAGAPPDPAAAAAAGSPGQ